VWKAVARRLAQWHAVLPVTSHVPSQGVQGEGPADSVYSPEKTPHVLENDDIVPITPRQAGPNTWTVLQKWILALPVSTEEQRQRRKSLQKELERIVAELDDGAGIGEDGVRFYAAFATLPTCMLIWVSSTLARLCAL